jgi:hypothetical protein
MWCGFALVAMAYLIIKHFLLDFGKLQPPWMYLNKGTYGHPGGIAHALVHALGSLPIFLWVSTQVTRSASFPFMDDFTLILFLFTMEFFIHYHMDWFKMWVSRKRGWSGYISYHTKPCAKKGPPQPGWLNPHLAIYSGAYFTLLGVDQLVHYLTYVGMIWAWVR